MAAAAAVADVTWDFSEVVIGVGVCGGVTHSSDAAADKGGVG